MDGARHVIDAHRGRYTVQRIGGAYVVVDPTGNVVARTGHDNLRAEEARHRLQNKADQAAKRGPRPCITCGNSFESEGIHNRMCPFCRLRKTDGWDPHGVAPRSGRPR